MNKFLLGIIAVVSSVLMCGCSCTNSISVKEEKVLVSEPQYSTLELLEIEEHPHLFDEYSNIEKFYEKVNDSRIAVVDVQECYQMEKKLSYIGEDTKVLYLIKDSTYHKYLGTMKINIFDPELCNDMNLDKAVKTVVAYLPEKFLDYYKKDSSYQFTRDNTSVYTYSVRLKESVSEQIFAPHYYYFRIFYYGDKNIWTIETGFAAYGNHGLEWIDKYAEDWNINLLNYF